MSDLERLKSVYARMLHASYARDQEQTYELLRLALMDLEVVMLSMGATPVEVGEIIRQAFTT